MTRRLHQFSPEQHSMPIWLAMRMCRQPGNQGWAFPRLRGDVFGGGTIAPGREKAAVDRPGVGPRLPTRLGCYPSPSPTVCLSLFLGNNWPKWYGSSPCVCVCSLGNACALGLMSALRRCASCRTQSARFGSEVGMGFFYRYPQNATQCFLRRSLTQNSPSTNGA